MQDLFEKQGYQTVNELRVQDFSFNNVKVFAGGVPQDFYCKLMVKYIA